MRFAIATTGYFESLGFETGTWRKTLDGKNAICHAEFALTLSNPDMLGIYNHDDPKLKELLAGPEWTKQTEDTEADDESKEN